MLKSQMLESRFSRPWIGLLAFVVLGIGAWDARSENAISCRETEKIIAPSSHCQTDFRGCGKQMITKSFEIGVVAGVELVVVSGGGDFHASVSVEVPDGCTEFPGKELHACERKNGHMETPHEGGSVTSLDLYYCPTTSEMPCVEQTRLMEVTAPASLIATLNGLFEAANDERRIPAGATFKVEVKDCIGHGEVALVPCPAVNEGQTWYEVSGPPCDLPPG